MLSRADLEHILVGRYGWQLHAQGPDALDRAIRQRMLWLECSDPNLYVRELDPETPEFSALLEEIVVPESWFFREREALAELTHWVTARRERQPNHTFRILSIPCSRGEEPISIAISLLTAGLPDDKLQIDAIDLSDLALEQARKGIYTSFSFRGEDQRFRDQAFEKLAGGWRICERFRAPITYQRYNALELPPFFLGYDAIFCRNLFIYLTESARLQLFHRFHRMLQPYGILFLAAAEFALPPSALFGSQSCQGVLVFHKSQANYLADTSHATPKARPPLLTSLNPKPPLSRPIRPMAQEERRPTRLPTESCSLPSGAWRLPAAAMPRVNCSSAATLLNQAEQSANQGRLEEAVVLCRQALQQGPSSHAYYLLALVNSAYNQGHEAESNLRRALYLDPDHKEALAQLALCREKSGDLEGSRRLRQRMKN